MKKVLLLAALGLCLVLAFYVFNSYISQKRAPDVKVPYEATITGEYACLPHRDTSGPVTLECAFGIKTESGEYYALDLGEGGDPSGVRMEEKVTLNGTITPIEYLNTDHWQKYETAGIFSIKKTNSNLIEIYSPLANSLVTSPLTVKGQARGNWFFEATFPVVLVDWDGKIIAEAEAMAKSNWMSEDFVQFEATLTFSDPSWEEDFSKRGTLIFKKSNPSGLPQNDSAFELPVLFAPLSSTLNY